MDKCFEYSEKKKLPPQNNSRMQSVSSEPREGRRGALLGRSVFITEGGEVLTAERLLSSVFGLASSFCPDKLDWESFRSASARENTPCNAEPFLHFSEKQKGITELSPPLPPIQLLPTGCNKPSTAVLCRDTLADAGVLPPVPHPANPTIFLRGAQIAAAG